MAGWLESMQDILGPPLSSSGGGGGSDAGSSIGMVAGSILGGPAGGALGSQVGGLFGSSEEPGSATAISGGELSGRDWNVAFGGGSSNLFLIGGALLLAFFLFKGK